MKTFDDIIVEVIGSDLPMEFKNLIYWAAACTEPIDQYLFAQWYSEQDSLSLQGIVFDSLPEDHFLDAKGMPWAAFH